MTSFVARNYIINDCNILKAPSPVNRSINPAPDFFYSLLAIHYLLLTTHYSLFSPTFAQTAFCILHFCRLPTADCFHYSPLTIHFLRAHYFPHRRYKIYAQRSRHAQKVYFKTNCTGRAQNRWPILRFLQRWIFTKHKPPVSKPRLLHRHHHLSAKRWRNPPGRWDLYFSGAGERKQLEVSSGKWEIRSKRQIPSSIVNRQSSIYTWASTSYVPRGASSTGV